LLDSLLQEKQMCLKFSLNDINSASLCYQIRWYVSFSYCFLSSCLITTRGWGKTSVLGWTREHWFILKICTTCIFVCLETVAVILSFQDFASARGIGVPVKVEDDQNHDMEVSSTMLESYLNSLLGMHRSPILSRLGLDPRFSLHDYPPILRGKKSLNFFPLPNGYYNQNKVIFRNQRSTQPSMENAETELVSIPWEMKYFSPMLRG